jgi:hypothetical protein
MNASTCDSSTGVPAATLFSSAHCSFAESIAANYSRTKRASIPQALASANSLSSKAKRAQE